MAWSARSTGLPPHSGPMTLGAGIWRISHEADLIHRLESSSLVQCQPNRPRLAYLTRDLRCVSRRLEGESSFAEIAHLGDDQGHELVQVLRIAVAPLPSKAGDLARYFALGAIVAGARSRIGTWGGGPASGFLENLRSVWGILAADCAVGR